MEEKLELAKQEYINTPFAYLKLQTGLSRLQQDIMNRVSAHLQKYFNSYWSDNDLRFSKENPRTFLTDEQIENLGPIRVNFSELRISQDSYERLDEARNKIMDIKIKGLVETEEGKKDRKWNVFPYVDLPVTDSGTTVMKKDREVDENGKVHKVGEAKKTETSRYRGYMEIYLNKDLIKEAFNMISGYVTHPEKIAQMGRVPNMPLMYYFIRHHMNNFKQDKDGKKVDTATVDIEELREYLGMTTRDAKGNIVKIKYPKYSRFKAQVLMVALDEIKRIYDERLIDVYFEMSESRPRGKKTGEPTSLTFTKRERGTQELASETPTKENRPLKIQTEIDFDSEQQEVKSSGISWLQIEQEKKKQEDANRWNSFVMHYEGRAKAALEKTKFHHYTKGKNAIAYIEYSDEVQKEFKALNITQEEKEDILKQISLHFPCQFKDLLRQ